MQKAPAHAIRRFLNLRYGLFIHYGLYSILNRREWAMYREEIPVEEYRKLADRLNPAANAVEEWVKLAKAGNMRYCCLTTRHHDGFSLFDTCTSDFNSCRSAAGRDLVLEFVESCRAHDIRPALYYSVGNWSDPGYRLGPEKDPAAWKAFVETAHVQLRELMSNYGTIDYLFYDGCPPPETWDAASLNAELRRLQPDLLISDRCGLEEDVASFENILGASERPYEVCMTINDSWGCNYGDINRKTIYDLLRTLACCIHGGGNFLLNLGPLADGSVPWKDRKTFQDIAGWIERNGEMIFETTPNPLESNDKLNTGRGSTVYVVLHWYHGPETVISGIGNIVQQVRLLGTDAKIPFSQAGTRLMLTGLPTGRPDVLPVVALELDGVPKGTPNPYACALK